MQRSTTGLEGISTSNTRDEEVGDFLAEYDLESAEFDSTMSTIGGVITSPNCSRSRRQTRSRCSVLENSDEVG
jgi:hypothetical protein